LLAEGQVSTLLQTINSTASAANQIIKTNPSLSAAYQEYLSADDSINNQVDAINTTLADINTNTTYEDNANLKIAQTNLRSAATDYEAFYKGLRLAVAGLASAPIGDSLANEVFYDTWDNAENQYKQGATAYASASTTLITLWGEDSSTKTKNGCNSAALQVYSDIANKVNNGLSCAQDGYTTGLDAVMCQLYNAGSIQNRSNGYWAIINRPTQ
jgi:hypothetical protein